MEEGLIPKMSNFKGHMSTFKQSLRNIGMRLQQLRPTILINVKNSPFRRRRGSYGEAANIKRSVHNAEVLLSNPQGPPRLDNSNRITNPSQARPNAQNLLNFVSKSERKSIRKMARGYDKPAKRGKYHL